MNICHLSAGACHLIKTSVLCSLGCTWSNKMFHNAWCQIKKKRTSMFLVFIAIGFTDVDVKFMSDQKMFYCVWQIWMAMTFCPTGQLWRSVRRTLCKSGVQSAPWGVITARTLPTTTSLMRRWPVEMRMALLSNTGTARVRETEKSVEIHTDILKLLLIIHFISVYSVKSPRSQIFVFKIKNFNW